MFVNVISELTRLDLLKLDDLFIWQIVKNIAGTEADDDTSCVHQFMLWIESGETPIHIVQQLLRCVEYAPDQVCRNCDEKYLV